MSELPKVSEIVVCTDPDRTAVKPYCIVLETAVMWDVPMVRLRRVSDLSATLSGRNGRAFWTAAENCRSVKREEESNA